MNQITRRTFFRGATLGAGGVLLAPLLRQIDAAMPATTTAAKAAARTAGSPRRFVFVLEGNGLNPFQIQPATIKRRDKISLEKVESLPLAGHELPEGIAPLKMFQDRLCILQGLSGKYCGGGHSNGFGALGCYRNGSIAGETIDLALGRALPAIFPQIGLGISKSAADTVIYNVSASGANKAVPTQCRPDLAYKDIFGSAAEGAGKQKFVARNNLLDFMADDIRRVQSRLDGGEKEKLDHYLHAYENLRHRQSRLNEVGGTLREKGPVVTDKFTSAGPADKLEAHIDIGAAALICGLTNVLTISSGSGDAYFDVHWSDLGIPVAKHTIGHGSGAGGRTAAQFTTIIRRYHMEQIARLAAKLQAVPEGSGTMLENTVIIYLSDNAEGHHSNCLEWPMLVLGDLGGRLKTKGRYLCYPKYGAATHRTTANLYLTLLQAAGGERKTFGTADIGLKDVDLSGPLSELMA